MQISIHWRDPQMASSVDTRPRSVYACHTELEGRRSAATDDAQLCSAVQEGREDRFNAYRQGQGR